MFNSYKNVIKSLCLIAVLSLVSFGSASAQLANIGDFLRAGADDAALLTREYLKPLPTGFGSGLNAGWSESAAPKKMLGFSLQFRPSVVLVPQTDQQFDISELGLQKIEVADGQNPVSPTIAGNNGNGPELVVNDDSGNEITRFKMPKGTGISFVPAPVVQASVGLIKKTDLTVRYFPQSKLGEFGSFGLMGAAVKHELTQWLPGGKLLPVDVSIMAGFNRIDLDANLNLKPEIGSVPNDPSNPGDFSDQQMSTATNTFVVNAMVGKSIPLLTAYLGAGYQKATFDLDITGDYPVSLPFNRYEVVNNPISLSMDSESSLHFLGGFRIRLGIIAIYGEATMANYFTANAGVGISFR